MPDNVTIVLSSDEALVLFELLAGATSETDAIALDHRAERIVLWSIESALEKLLVEPFDPDYERLLEEARERIGHLEN